VKLAASPRQAVDDRRLGAWDLSRAQTIIEKAADGSWIARK
jgi:hypothetical protein